MERGEHLKVGELVQLNPETCRNRMLAGCIMTVTEPKVWGAQGYVGPSSFRVEPNSQNPWSSSSPVGMWAGCL